MIKLFSGIASILFAIGNCSGQTTELQKDLALQYLVRLPSVKTTHPPLIILLHGYGSDERDMFEMKNDFPKNYVVIAARAPYPVGTQGYQWFEIDKNDGKSDEVRNSRALLVKFISQVVGIYKADPKMVYLVGFSQGAMMCYETGLLHPDLLKGIGILSGRIFPALKQEVVNTPELNQLKIFIAHGTDDSRIPYVEARTANDYLKNLGLKPEFHVYTSMGHSISKNVVSDLLRWLSK